MRALKVAGVGAALALLTACPAERTEPAADPAADVPVTEVGPGLEREEIEALPLPESVDLQEVQGSGVSGEAVVSPVEDGTHVALLVRSGPANASLQGSLHQGRCATPGARVGDAGTVQLDAAGTGQADVSLDIPAHLVFDGQHHVRLHGAGEAADRLAACGDIPARSIPRLEAEPPAAAPEPEAEPTTGY